MRSWSAVGGWFSMTSRLNERGGAEGFEGGYGPLTAALRSFRADTEDGMDGLWLSESHVRTDEQQVVSTLTRWIFGAMRRTSSTLVTGSIRSDDSP